MSIKSESPFSVLSFERVRANFQLTFGSSIDNWIIFDKSKSDKELLKPFKDKELQRAIKPTSVKDDVLEEKVCGIFYELGVGIGQRDIQACHQIKNNRTILKLSNRKDCLQVLRAKKRLKDLYGTTLNLPSDTKIFINESLCGYYRGLWNKCKRLKGDKKIHQVYTNNGIIPLKLVENGSVKTITHVNDLKDLFPDIDIDNLQLFSLVLLYTISVDFVVAFGRQFLINF